MTKSKETNDTATPVAEEQQPQQGGSYVRRPGGKLERVDKKSTAAESKPAIATYPADKAKAKGN